MIKIQIIHKGRLSAYRLIGKSDDNLLNALYLANEEILLTLENVYLPTLEAIIRSVKDPKRYDTRVTTPVIVREYLDQIVGDYNRSVLNYMDKSSERKTNPTLHLQNSFTLTLDWIRESYQNYFLSELLRNYKGESDDNIKKAIQGALDLMYINHVAYRKFLERVADELFKRKQLTATARISLVQVFTILDRKLTI